MEVKVTVLTPNGRRHSVRVTPNTTLLQILEEACRKHGFDSEEYCLRHHNKEVSLSQMFRFSGLPNNCLLEMTTSGRKRVAADVEICLQLEDGSRQQAQFKPGDSLWQVVERLGAHAVSGYTSPVMIYMRQEIIGQEQMSATTLKSLGIMEGRAIMRLINKNPEELRTQASVYVAPVVRETADKQQDDQDERRRNLRNIESSGGGGGSGGFSITKDLVQSLREKPIPGTIVSTTEVSEMEEEASTSNDAVQNQSEKPKYDWGTGSGRSMRNLETPAGTQETSVESAMEVEPEYNIIGERKALIYSLESTQTHIEDLPDSFFDLTVNDLKLVLRDLKKIASGNEDTPLLTEKLRELEGNKIMLNKIAQYKNCVIRVQFPDRYVLQGMFKPIDKIADVMEFVGKFLAKPESAFYLFTIPPKTVLDVNKTLLELDLVPNALVHFAFEDELMTEEIYVKSEFLQNLTTAEGALHVAKKFRIANPETNLAKTNETGPESMEVSAPSTGAIPKRPRNEEVKKR